MKRFLVATLLCASAPVGLAGPLPKADAVFPPQDQRLVDLGWNLFFDPLLSGAKQVACASCHHPKLGTGDGLSLGLGDGGLGLGVERRADPENMPEQRIARHAPALFNLGAEGLQSLFYDGRLEVSADFPSGIRTPLGASMIAGFSGLLSAQSMFPVLSADEMAGHYSENDIAKTVRQGVLTGPDGAWQRIADRVLAIEDYRAGFVALYGAEAEIGFTHVSDALAAFMAQEWRSDDSPFDRYLRDGEPLPEAAERGMQLFYGKAGCDSCHTGQFQSDQKFHAIAMPQLGPGKAARFERHHRDVGRARVSGESADMYAFRTPSLRNVVETAPYGHSGAYATLEAVVRHHFNPVEALKNYDKNQALLPELDGAEDWWVMHNSAEVEAIAAANQLPAQQPSDDEVRDLLAFLAALTDPVALTGRLGVPDTVPSGLAVPE